VWSPDEPSGTETFEQGDEALDEASRINLASLMNSKTILRLNRHCKWTIGS
jgi:hypothetical protein